MVSDFIVMSGRPSDAIWLHFNRRNDLGPNKAECRNCKHVITGNAQRMRAHWQRHENEYPEMSSVALNKMQSDSIEIATGFEVWKDLLSTFREMGSEGREWLEVVERRYENSVPPLWCLANVLHPNFVGKKLTTKEWKSAKDCFVKMYPDDVPEFIHFIVSFKDQYNNEYEQSGCPVVADFIKSQVLTGELSVKLGNVSEKILNLPPSSAGIERVFSSLGYVHSDVRNRLGQEKAAKLAFVLRALKKEHYF